MFLPNPNAREEREAKRRLLERIEQWGIDRLPADLRDDVQLLVQEIDCSDPACSPVDTIVTVVFARYVPQGRWRQCKHEESAHNLDTVGEGECWDFQWKHGK